MTIESLPLSDLHEDPANARRHSTRNIDAIKSSLARFGQQKPIVIDARNLVRAGNGTLLAAKALGWTHLDVVRTDLIGVEATAFAITDNRTAELAEWDPDVLNAVLRDPDIGDLSFNADDLDGILKREPEAEPEPPTSIGETFQVIAECEGEQQQQQLFERLTGEGFSCRLLTL
jgi:ParB family chromosome partitioning protein